MSKKVFNSDLETTGSVSCSSISTGSVTGTGVSVTGNISASLNVSANAATLNAMSSPLVVCTRIQPITGKTIEVSSSDSGESADTPLTLKIIRTAQASCALELSEVNAGTGAQEGVRLAYQGANDESLGIPGVMDVNSSALQILNKPSAEADMQVFNILSSNRTATDVRLSSEGDLSIGVGASGSITLAGSSEVSSGGTSTPSLLTNGIVCTPNLTGVGGGIQCASLECTSLIVDGVTYINDSTGILFNADFFSATHTYISENYIKPGNVVVLNARVVALPQTAQSSKLVVGVVAHCKEAEGSVKTSLGEVDVTQGQYVVKVISVGDSRHLECEGFNVCNENGDIQPGDLLVTSSTPGYLMKQDDDIIRSCTVGKAMEEVTFDENGQATGVYGYIYCG